VNIIDSILDQDIWVQALRAGGAPRRKKGLNRTKGINERERERGNKPSRMHDDPVGQASKKRQRGRVNEVVEIIMGKVKDWHDMDATGWNEKTPDERKNQVNEEIDWGKVNYDFNFIAEWNNQIVNDIIKKLDEFHKMDASL